MSQILLNKVKRLCDLFPAGVEVPGNLALVIRISVHYVRQNTNSKTQSALRAYTSDDLITESDLSASSGAKRCGSLGESRLRMTFWKEIDQRPPLL